MTKFKIGDKVKILNKTVPGFEISIKDLSKLYPKLIGYITFINGNGNGNKSTNAIAVKNKEHTQEGYFRKKDLKLFNHKKPKHQVFNI